MPRLLIRSVEFEGPIYETWPPPAHRNIFLDSSRKEICRRMDGKLFASSRPVPTAVPPRPAEESTLMAVFQKSFGAGPQFQESVKDALQVVLTSPQFLFLIEKSSTPEPEPLDNYELASKLSFFLWNGTARSHDVETGCKRRAPETTGCGGGADDRGSALLPVHQ
jgi:hypothetical protein